MDGSDTRIVSVDLDYNKSKDILQKLIPRHVPGLINNNTLSKTSKRPLYKGWMKITEEKSAELASQANHRDGPFIYLTGETTKHFVVDLDTKDPLRKDHEQKIDGVEYWTQHFEEPDTTNTLVIKTPSGGYHLIYKYEKGVTSGELEKGVLIDILSDGRGMFFGPGYKMLNLVRPVSAPRKLINIIYNNNNYGVQQQINYGAPEYKIQKDYSSEINIAANSDVKWDVITYDNSFTIIPHTSLCTVDDNYSHTEDKHSWFVVSKNRVVAKCHNPKHKERVVTGLISKRIREIFYSDINTFEQFMNDVIELCHGESFFRADGFVWKAKKNKPWIYDKVASYENFINMYFHSNPVFVKNPKKFVDVVKYMETIQHQTFPLIKKCSDYVGFKNCAVNVVTHELLDGNSWKTTSIPRHYIDDFFDWNNTNTPLFDNLVQHQLGSGDIYTYFIAFIGRLFYKVKRFDNYNVVPWIKGHSATGKSTILTIIKNMFASGSVGVLNSNNETTFGLQSKYNKELLIAHEISENFKDKLSSDLFKQMVCGEDVSVPRKNKDELVVEWGVPMFLCSNVHLSYKNDQGSITRRLAIFKFDKHVLQKDTTLETRIIKSELPALVAKCLLAYKSMIERIGAESFWESCPEYFHENVREMSEETDYIYMFLTLPPGDNIYGNKDMYFKREEGSVMLLQDFKRKFLNYMRYRHPGVKYRWNSDYDSFERLGYRIDYINVCKGCGSRSKTGCCSEYNTANRSRRYVIENICCVENTIEE